MGRYRVDLWVAVKIEDVEVEVGSSTGDFARGLGTAALERISDRLVLLDVKGGRCGDDGVIVRTNVTSVTNWDRRD